MEVLYCGQNCVWSDVYRAMCMERCVQSDVYGAMCIE
jgi:hypothetical protein